MSHRYSTMNGKSGDYNTPTLAADREMPSFSPAFGSSIPAVVTFHPPTTQRHHNSLIVASVSSRYYPVSASRPFFTVVLARPKMQLDF